MANGNRGGMLRVVAGLAAGVGLAAPHAMGQGASFTTLPNPPALTDVRASNVSPDGRYVTGFYQSFFTTCDTGEVYRWDRTTGQVVQLAVQLHGVYASVLDDGRVFTSTARRAPICFQPGARVLRWNPSTGEVLYVPRPTNTDTEDIFVKVSADGTYGIGYTDPPDGPAQLALFDFTLSTPMRVDLSAGLDSQVYSPLFGQLGIGGVTLPVNGVRRAYGTTVGPDGVLGRTWVVANAQPMTAPYEVYDVSPDGAVFLGKIGANYFVDGGSAGRSLPAPIFPTIMHDPIPKRISADGRVTVGYADFVPGDSFSAIDGVVWRAGQNPTTLRAVLQGAGVVVPAWEECWLTGVSSDGSVVVGTYQAAGDLQPYVSFAAVLPALNDNCQSARAVTYGTVIDSTSGATRAGVSAGQTCAAEGNAPDVWFSFVPAATESVTIDTCGSSFDTTLSVFAGSCAALGSPLACNDEAAVPCAGNVHASRLSVNVSAGQTYFIRVSGWQGGYGSVQMTITAPNRPANDACQQAVSISSGSGAFWSNTGAITDNRPNCSGTPFSDIYFRAVPAENGRMTYSTCGSTINTVNQVFAGSACGDFSIPPLYCSQGSAGCGGTNGSRLTVPCTAGQAQIIRVGGLFGATGNGQITARFACDQNDLGTYAVRVVNDGAAAYWRFDDSGSLTMADSVRGDPFTCGNFPGEYVNNVVRLDAYRGKALTLNGDGAHARAEAFPFGRWADPASCPRVTLEAWVKTTDAQAGVVLTSRNNPGEHSTTLVVGYNPIGLPNTEGRAMFISDGPGVLYGAMSSVRVDDGRWHHIVGMRTPNAFGGYTHVIYVDGVFQFNPLSGPSGTFNGSHGQYWTVGNGLAWPSSGAAFNGQIDDAAVYCGELLVSQIQDHYSIGVPPPCDSIDFNGDGLFPDVQDIADFIAVFSGAPCPTGACGDIDFNNDGLFPDTEDISSLIRVFGGGAC